MSEELKQKITTFTMLVKDQFVYGGKKYALEKKRESTDLLFDDFGANWLYGTIAKYLFRFQNLQRERDLLKIACYSYILWLKRGFFIDDRREVPIDTNIKIKEVFFEEFINKVREFILDKYLYRNNYCHFVAYNRALSTQEIQNYYNRSLKMKEKGFLDKIFSILKSFTKLKWKDITEESLLEIFFLSFIIWRREFAEKKEHDTDTWLEEKKEVK